MNSIVIIGLGLMGGSVAKALKNKNPEILSPPPLSLPAN